MAVAVGSLVGSASMAQSGDLLATVLATMLFATLTTGLFLLAVGVFRLGGLARYIPYPVVGGFLAGTGWLLIRGSFEVVTGLPATLSGLSRLLEPEIIILWLPAVIVTLTLLIGLRKLRSFLTLPALLIGLLAAFYLVLWLTGTPLSTAREMGLLLVSDEGLLLQLPSPMLLKGANIGAVLGQTGNIAVVAGIALVSLMLNATSLELVFQNEVDINRELRAAGVTNMFTTFTGGMVGFLSVSLSPLIHRTGSRSHLPSIIAAVLLAFMLFFGFGILAYFPKAILGGLLLFLGIDFLNEWVISSLKRFTPIEYTVVFLILIVIASTDFLVGVGVGLIAMIIMFVVSYSRVSVVQHILSGAQIHSNVERNAIEQRELSRRGEGIYIVELRGFLFFGTANSMVELIRDRVADKSKMHPKFVLIDFKNVTGLDSSAALSFVKTEQLAKKNDFKMVLTGASTTHKKRLQNGGLSYDCEWVCYFTDMDRGLEWCEEHILKEVENIDQPLSGDLYSQLCELGFDSAFALRFINYLEPITVNPGERLIRQGVKANALYYIEKGKVSVFLEREDGDPIRLRNIRTGSTVGEMGFYTGAIRTASVIAEETTSALRLDQNAITEMTRDGPELASAFHKWIAQLLSDRLARATLTIDALQPR
jgi:SulP family sulfate permease